MRRLITALICASLAVTARSAQAGEWFASFNQPGSNSIVQYPLVPNTFGVQIATPTNPQDLTLAGNKLYWIDGNNVDISNLDGSDLMTLEAFGISPTSIAVDSTNNAWYASFNQPGSNSIVQYPLIPNTFGVQIVAPTNPQDLTLAGGKLYWIDGNNVDFSNLDGSDLTTLETFGISPTSIAVDSADNDWYASFNQPGSNSIVQYPLVPNTFGVQIATPTNPRDLTLAGEKLYWIDGKDVDFSNLDGSGLTTLETFGISPTSIAVNDPAMMVSGIPEPVTLSLFAAGLAGVVAMRRCKAKG